MPARRALDWVPGELGRLRAEGLERRVRTGRVEGSRITVGGRSLLNMCSNDYLGLGGPPPGGGQMASSSRLLAGSSEEHRLLEDALASHKSHGAALVYPTGYMACMGALTALAGEGDLVASDALNHASIVDACRLSRASVAVYAHNDPDDLREKLRRPARNRFVVCEGIFSMDGDYARLAEISEAASGAGAALVVDDAHGDFAVGPGGTGTPGELGVRADVYVSSLSKALGSFGGYVASDRDVIDLCASRSRQFVYTSALPAQVASHALARVGSDRSAAQASLGRARSSLASGLRSLGIDPGDTHIMPVRVGDERRAVDLAARLEDGGVYAPAIRYPTVRRGAARLRFSATGWMTGGDTDEAACALGRALGRAPDP
ncbi:MAG: aminotransferase class I/II-fold pyridoxal phosphate-dependent enzyme [Nitrosopumilus sp.]|nr:aminotransferase class I/II-fold pyridoxal phosphate-dependent enzyme [Nitrosopumilus sp.]